MQRLWDKSPPRCILTVSMRHGKIDDKARIFANPASAHHWGQLCKPPLPSFCRDSDAFVDSWRRGKSYSEAQGFHSWDVKDHIRYYPGSVKLLCWRCEEQYAKYVDVYHTCELRDDMLVCFGIWLYGGKRKVNSQFVISRWLEIQYNAPFSDGFFLEICIASPSLCIYNLWVNCHLHHFWQLGQL